MQIVIGLFKPSDSVAVVSALKDKGFSQNEISLLSSVTEIPEFLEADSEETAAAGAAVGAVAGGAVGAIGTFAVSAIPGLETYFVSGVMATTAGMVIGGYLGSLYSVRADTQTEMDIHEELESGKILLVVQVNEANAEAAEGLFFAHHGEYVETHTVPDEADKD